MRKKEYYEYNKGGYPGGGTRYKSSSRNKKNMPKEMYPIVDKPTIQFIVEEAVAAGITDILIITNRGKGLMEDHFDASPELESLLEKSGKTEFLETVRNISNLANISFIRQKEMKGLGHAVLKAKSFVGNEPFAVMYGDGVITGKVPAIKQLIDHYGEYGEGVVGVKKVDAKDIHKYGSLKVEHMHDNIFCLYGHEGKAADSRRSSFHFIRFLTDACSRLKFSKFSKIQSPESAEKFSLQTQ